MSEFSLSSLNIEKFSPGEVLLVVASEPPALHSLGELESYDDVMAEADRVIESELVEIADNDTFVAIVSKDNERGGKILELLPFSS